MQRRMGRRFVLARAWSSSSSPGRRLAGDTAGLEGSQVRLSGWLSGVRPLKKMAFAVLRDHSGSVQLQASGEAGEELAKLPVESAVTVTGTVIARPSKAVNKDMATGQVEVLVKTIEWSNRCATNLPFPVGDTSVSEEVRLKHRFLDLRSERLQNTLRVRARIVQAVRGSLQSEHFVEVETPTLFRPTPEGAKEFLVVTRWPELFYSLPQSPQQYKQLLMAGGIDRYFQMARCYRDEDMRADRQPEFTQVDLELSWGDEDTVQGVAERAVQAACEAAGRTVPAAPFPRMNHEEAIRRFGIDKPDLRLQSEIEILSSAANIDWGRKLRVPEGRAASRDAVLAALTGIRGVEALVDGEWLLSEPAEGFSVESRKSLELEKGTVLFASGHSADEACLRLGRLRGQVETLSEESRNELNWLWVTNFPLFENEGTNGAGEAELKAAHHPFTAPAIADEMTVMQSGSTTEALLNVKSRAYDLVLNGVELGGGSVRIHSAELQRTVLSLLGVSSTRIQDSMEHLLSALSLGCPPHAGLAFGLDRLVMMLVNASSLKDVIAFPKAADGRELMVGSPARISSVGQEKQ